MLIQRLNVQGLRNRCARGGQGGIEQLGLSSDDHASVSSKLEVRCDHSSVDFANEFSSGVVDPDAIAAANIDTALGVGFYTCETR
jgi:hypothetical protein